MTDNNISPTTELVPRPDSMAGQRPGVWRGVGVSPSAQLYSLGATTLDELKQKRPGGLLGGRGPAIRRALPVVVGLATLVFTVVVRTVAEDGGSSVGAIVIGITRAGPTDAGVPERRGCGRRWWWRCCWASSGPARRGALVWRAVNS